MNFCTQCGNHLKPDARFCSKCGQIAKEEEKPIPVIRSQQPLCTKCGIFLVPGVKFCTSCGAPAQLTTVQPPPSVSPPPQRIQTLQTANQSKKKKGKKVLVFAVSSIVLLAAVGAAVYFFGTFEPKETYADLSTLYEEEKYDQAKIDSSATAVETIFLAADTVKLAQILSPTTLEHKRQFFSEIQPHMAAYGNDFKTRKLLYATARFAVYEFTSDQQGTFTVDFCLGPDGTWKLMRF